MVALSWMVSEIKTEDRVLEVALPKAAKLINLLRYVSDGVCNPMQSFFYLSSSGISSCVRTVYQGTASLMITAIS